MTSMFLTLNEFFDSNWPGFLPELPDPAVLDHVWIEPLETSLGPDEVRLVARLLFEQELLLRLPGFDAVSLLLAPGGGGTIIPLAVDIRPDFALRLSQVPIALRFDSSLLQPMRPVTDAMGHTTFEIDPERAHVDIPVVNVSLSLGWSGDINFSGGLSVSGFSISPFMPGRTGLVLELEDYELDLSGESTPDAVLALGCDASFRGVYARTGRLHWLPGFIPDTSDVPGLHVTFENAAIGYSADGVGASFDVAQTWAVGLIDGQFTGDTELKGYLLDPAWSLALSRIEGTIRHNTPQRFFIAGMLRVPLLGSILGVEFGLGGDDLTSLAVYKADDTPLEVELIQGSTLSFTRFLASGTLGEDSFSIEGRIGGRFELAGFDPIELEQARITVAHSAQADELTVEITGVEFGSLGQVENARLRLTSTTNADTGEKTMVMVAETTLAWVDLHSRLNLDDLPDMFPLPPDDAQVTAFLSWEDGDLKLRFSADVAGVDSLWPFLPTQFRPDMESASFTFEATHQANDQFFGVASLEVRLRLPALPELPGADLFKITTGDETGLVKAVFKGSISVDENGASRPIVKASLENPISVDVNIPGIPQSNPPIHTSIRGIDVDLGVVGDNNLAGGIALTGNFSLRPIDPAGTSLPIPPVMASHLQKLFQAVGLSDLEGEATFNLKFKDDRAALAMSCEFVDAGLELDLFDMLAGLARGLPAPQGMDSPANTIDVDIEVGLELRRIGLQLGSIEEGAPGQSQFGLEMALDFSFAGAGIDDFYFKLSDQEFSFGFAEMSIPLAIPHFPLSLEDLNQLQDSNGRWDLQIWSTQEGALTAAIDGLKADVQDLKAQIEALDAQLAGVETGDGQAQTRAQLKDLKERKLPVKNKELFHITGQRFLIQSIFAIYNAIPSGQTNRDLYQTYVEFYMGIMDATIHQVYLDTQLLLVLHDVRFVLPFQNPSDIRVEGGAQLAGFEPDNPFAPLGDLQLRLGLSTEYIYFSVEGGGDLIPLPFFRYYVNEEGQQEAKASASLNHFRLGYGYSKNALNVALAGELKIARQLAQDLDTSDIVGAGIRLPEQSRLGFKLDLIPIVLGEVDFLLPLLEFDVDLRKDGSPGIAATQTCTPHWDGLQLIAPNVIRYGLKRLHFAPFFGPLPAPNLNYSFDISVGDENNGMTHVCDDYLVITPVMGEYILPLLADGTPFFDNLCTTVRLAGFGVNFNLQRPFPSMSPLALFEVLGLLADPMMPIDPGGALANTIRATIQDARITLPPAVVRMFPEYGTILAREVNYTVNLGTLITIAQAIGGAVGQMMQTARDTAQDAEAIIDYALAHPPDMTPGALLALLPPELRKFELHGSFVGFEASATFVLLTPEQAADEFKRRDKPGRVPTSLPPPEKRFHDPTWLTHYQPTLPAGEPPVYMPLAPGSHLLQGAEFEAFDAKSLKAIRLPLKAEEGVLVAARVKLLENQVYRFLGYLFADGSFGLVSALDIQPLRFSIAGISVELPLEIQGRLALQGQAKGADSYARVSAEGWGTWDALGDLVRLEIASPRRPASLELNSRGGFAIKGGVRLLLFKGAAELAGNVDISHTHCFVDGQFLYKPDWFIGRKRVLELSLASRGRIGPGDGFELRGEGTLQVLGNLIGGVQGIISDKGAALEGVIDTGNWSWHGLPINQFRAALRGQLDVSQPGAPAFSLAGEAYLRLFGTDQPGTGAEIEGRGGIKSQNGDLTTFVEGNLHWQGREWLGGQIELGTGGASIEGQATFALPLLNLPDALKTRFASLFIQIELGGRFSLNPAGRLTRCQIETHWMLAVRLPGADEQVMPVAMQTLQIGFSHPGNTSQLVTIQDLVSIDRVSLLPVDDLVLPIPQVTPKSPRRLYLAFESKDLATSINAPKIVGKDSSSADYKIPVGVSVTTTKVNVIGAVRTSFNTLVDLLPGDPLFTLPAPPVGTKVEITVPDFEVDDEIGIDTSASYPISTPSVQIPRLSTDPIRGATALLEVPTDFDVEFEDQSLGTVLEDLAFTVSLGWQGNELGIVVKKGNTKKFTPLAFP